MEALFIFIVLDLHIILSFCAYRRRKDIKDWLNNNGAYYAEDDRELRLRRRKEDAERELAWIDANKTTK